MAGFGFSVGDFITIGEKAVIVYRKCTSATKDYGNLARHVHTLHEAILDIQKFAENDEIPADAHKIASLKSARLGCVAVLDEVDAFLEKHASIGSNKKRLIDIAKFITKDVDGLEAKLIHSTSLLQLGLASLTSLSVTQVQKTLDNILQEYRSGRREPTILSHALLDNKPVPKEVLLDQVASDLEDKDVHPDSITLNKGFIASWLSHVISDGGLDEASDETASPAPDGKADLQLALTKASLSQHLSAVQAQPMNSSLQESPTVIPVDELALPTVDEDALTISRPCSAQSHRSKPEDWHPSNRPDPEYVYSMLCRIFQGDYLKPQCLDETRTRIIRAFNQQDWSHRGFLDRQEVAKLCSEVLKRREWSCLTLTGTGDADVFLTLSFRIVHEKGPLVVDVYRSILDHLDFERKRDNPSNQLLWVKGNAGKGKTMLLVGIINEMARQPEQSDESDGGQGYVVAYFFCQGNDPRLNNAPAVVQGLINLLVAQQPQLVHHLKNSCQLAGPNLFKDVNAIFALSNILTDMVCETKQTVYLIIDALDECDEVGLNTLLSQILKISSRCSNIRWLVSSRENGLIKEKLKPGKTQGVLELELNAVTISPAVDIYIDHKVSTLDSLKHDTTLRSQVRTKISEKADTTFLWVALVCEELQAVGGAWAQRVLEEAPCELRYMKQRARARRLLKQGYAQYMAFKKDPRKVYQKLTDAIKTYKEAFEAASSSGPIYGTGVIRAYISLAECHRELSHSRKLEPEAKMEQVEKAEKYIQKAVRLAVEKGDEGLAQRARFEQAVLCARKVLVRVKMKQPDLVVEVAPMGEISATLATFKQYYASAGDEASVGWADYWLKQLENAK